MRVWHVHGVSHGAVQTLVNGTVNSVVSGSVGGLVNSPVEVQVLFHRLSMGNGKLDPEPAWLETQN